MPFTPFHFGPSSCVALIFVRFINFGAFLFASVIVDIEPLCTLVLNSKYPLHGFFHSFLGGTIVAVLLSVVFFRFKTTINAILGHFKLAQNSSLSIILFSCLLGVYFHIFLDSFLYTDICPFFPLDINPFYGIISAPLMYLFCFISFFMGGLFYFMRKKQERWKYFFNIAGIIVLIGFIFIIFLVLKETLPWSKKPLVEIQKQIDSAVLAVYKTGRDIRITFTFHEDGGALVISPAYANISEIGKDVFNQELCTKMQSYVNSQEVGHLFYINNGNLTDHRIISNLSEPILGMKTKKAVVFLVSRKLTSGRPVRIEILP
jgi:hypothetical protein